MISKEFIKSSFVYSFIGALPLASSFILLPFYTNLLTTNDFGMLMLYIAFTALIQIIVNFGLDNFVALYYVEVRDDKIKQKQYVGTSIISLFILGAFIILLFFLVGNPIFNALNNVLYKKKDLIFFPWGFMCVVTAFFNSFFKTYTNLLIYQQRPGRFFWMNIFNFTLTIAISVIGIYMYPYSLLGPMWGRLLSGVGIFILAFIFFMKEFGINFSKEYLKPLFDFCYPLVLYLLILWVVGNIDRYIILYFSNPTEVGIFDFAIKCTFLLEFTQNGLTSAIQPKIFNIWKDQNQISCSTEVNRYYNGLTAVSLLLIPIFIIAIPVVIPLFVNNSAYYNSFSFLAVLSLGFATRGLYTIYISPILYLRKSKVLPKIFFISAIIQIIASTFLIKFFGIVGAVWAVFLLKPIQVFLLYLEVRKDYVFKFNKKKQIYLPLAYCILILIGEQFLPYINRILLYSIELFIIGALVILTYKKELILTFEKFTKK